PLPGRKKPNGAGASIRSSMHELPLRPYHEFAGALFRSEAEWDVPAGYRSLDEEVASVRHGAGLVDLSDRAKLELTGSERVTFLDGLVTIDVKILTPGTSAYALLLNEKSRVLADARVYAFRDSLILDMDASQAPRVREILEKGRVSDDVEFRQLRSAGHIAVERPNAADLLTKGCYVGQEIVARGTYVGQVRRKLAGILVDGDQPPVHGDRVLKADRQVGVVTSGTWSPTLGSAIALALLRIDEFATTEPLHIDRGGWDLRGRPHSLPFVRA